MENLFQQSKELRKLRKIHTPVDKHESDLTEAEKMVSGLLYNALDEELRSGFFYTKALIHKLNQLNPTNVTLRKQLLQDLFGTYKDNYIEPPFFCDFGTNIDLDENVYINHNCIFLDECNISVGAGTFFGPNVQVYTATHPIDPVERRVLEYAKPVKIGRECWIGGSAVILPGVTIGDGVTVGAGSVVTKDVESYVVVAGNPAKIIKRLKKPPE